MLRMRMEQHPLHPKRVWEWGVMMLSVLHPWALLPGHGFVHRVLYQNLLGTSNTNVWELNVEPSHVEGVLRQSRAQGNVCFVCVC